MKRAAPIALAALLLVPAATALPDVPDYPDELLALVPGWIADVEAMGADDAERPWYPQAKAFLDGAKQAQADGRVRKAMFDLETYSELVLTGQLEDETAPLGSDAERKSVAIQRANQWRADAQAEWARYREKLRTLEGDIRSLHAMEVALWSADNALNAGLSLGEHDNLVRELPKQEGFPRDYVLALARADHTALLNLRWASDALDAAGKYEGLPPRLVLENWTIETTEALKDPGYERVPPHLEALENIAKDIRANNETTLAMAIALAEQRASRATNIMVIFGDARSRGLDVTSDAARGMAKQLNNTSIDAPRSYGLLGLFTADAIDRATTTYQFHEKGQADLGVIIAAWSQLDHAGVANTALAAASPIVPPPTPEPNRIPAGGAMLALVALGMAATALRARRG